MLGPPALAAAPERVGGSNYAWYALDGCDRQPYGVIGNYDRQKPEIDAELRQMYANGQRRLRLRVGFGQGVHLASVLYITREGLDNQAQKNLGDLLASIKEIGFEEVILGSFPIGSNDAIHWKRWDEDLYQENWRVIQQIRQIGDAANLPYLIDLQNEGVPFVFQTFLVQYDRRLWQDYVTAYGPTKTVGFSAISDPGRLREIPTIYGGIWPEAIDIHLYDHAGEELQETDRLLRQMGLGDIPLIIGEAYYNDAQEAEDLIGAMKGLGRRVLYLTQWPNTRSSHCDAVSTIPLEFNAYRNAGF